MSSPFVSVCMVTYQHEKYVGDAVRSVLAQSFDDFELVVVNDGSTDGTAEELAKFDDPRLRVINQHNQGPAVATNVAIAAARGEYIALFSGDDVCHPNRLSIQVDAARQEPDAMLFSGVDFINDDGQPLENNHFASALFAGETVTQGQVLARLFHRGNFLNGVTTFGRRDIFAANPYDATLLQLQDFELWTRLIKNHNIRVLPEKLVYYRIRGSSGNLSAPSPDAVIRSSNEHYLVLRHIFDNVSMDLFRSAFSDSLVRPDFNGDVEYRIEQAFLYARSGLAMARAIGVERLHELLNQPNSAAVLANRYQFTPLNYFELMRTADAFNLLGGHFSTMFFDTGAGFNAAQELRIPVNPSAGPFSIRFIQPAGVQMKHLRWDPVECRTCRVKVDAIEMVDSMGNCIAVNLNEMITNGTTLADGSIEFETNDPAIWWPCPENVASVRIRGQWSFDQLPDTVRELRSRLATLEAELELERATIVSLPRRFARKLAIRLRAG